MLERLVDLKAEEQAKAAKEIESIFFLTSSRKNFASEVEKRRFAESYLLSYLHAYRDFVWLTVDDAKDFVTGYLTGCPDSEGARSQFEVRLGSYMLFGEQFGRFPAHLHINVHPSAQGQGLGRKLVLAFENQMLEGGCHGVHLVTDAKSKNVRFYSALGYQEVDRKPLNSAELVCLAKDL